MSIRQQLIERFFRYVAVTSQSDIEATTLPSTPGQQRLAELLADELRGLGLDDVEIDDRAELCEADSRQRELYGLANDGSAGAALSRVLDRLGLAGGRIAVDEGGLPPSLAAFRLDKPPSIDAVDGFQFFRQVRAVKTPLEVERLRKAASIAEASIEAAFDRAEERFGPMTGVVANAGINAEGRAIDLPIDAFDSLFATNVRGVFLTARIAARRLQSAGRASEGRIVLISSITARMQTSGVVAYSASKAAVTHMGRCLAREWARTGPNVTTLSPGYIRSELAGDWFDGEQGKKQMTGWPRRRLLEEDALDDMLIYLLSDGSAGVTGADFVVDDGQSL